MIIKREFNNNVGKRYSLHSGIATVDVGLDVSTEPTKNYIIMHKQNGDEERIDVIEGAIYICSDEGKTLEIIRPVRR